MSHPNVLRTEGVAPELFKYCIVSRWMDYGSRLEYLRRHPEPIDRLGLVCNHSDHLDGMWLRSLIAIPSSCLGLSVALITCIPTELFTVT